MELVVRPGLSRPSASAEQFGGPQLAMQRRYAAVRALERAALYSDFADNAKELPCSK
ncbi:hypothetical protein SBBP2_150003 [Burkholderiales bacterium]|nr:hypothetical protein SBBP2_150003 [Burkholderiales bacterium]